MNAEKKLKKESANIIKKFFLFGLLGDGTLEEALLLWIAVAVWSYFYLSAVMMIILLVAVLIIPKTFKAIMREKKMFYFGVIIGSYSFLVSVIAKNFIGMAISFGVFMVITLGAFAKSVMTEERFQKIQVISCIGSLLFFIVSVFQYFLYGSNIYYKPVSLAYNANYYGTLVTMMLIICGYNVFCKKETIGKSAWYKQSKIFYIVFTTMSRKRCCKSDKKVIS